MHLDPINKSSALLKDFPENGFYYQTFNQSKIQMKCNEKFSLSDFNGGETLIETL